MSQRHEICGNSILGTMVMLFVMGFLGVAGLNKLDDRYREMTATILHEQQAFF